MRANRVLRGIIVSVSAREDQPATVPPPAGEDDAYNATTKVGAMPAELMARLRAEGLLPDEAERQAPVSPGSTKSGIAPKAPPVPTASTDGPVPTLYSTAPPRLNKESSPSPPPSSAEGSEMAEAESPVLHDAPEPPLVPSSAAPAEVNETETASVGHGLEASEASEEPVQRTTSSLVVETPTAFVAPPEPGPMVTEPELPPEVGEPSPIDQHLPEPSGGRFTKLVSVLVGVLLVIAIIMALLHQRR